MTVQVIPVRTMGPVQTEWTDSTAAVHQDLMAHNVKPVTMSKFVFFFFFFHSLSVAAGSIGNKHY